MELSDTSKETVLEELIAWFLNSAIFDGEAYLEYYSRTGNGPKYPEITGYAISLCCILYGRKKDRRFLDRAEACAKFMAKINTAGGVPCLRDDLLYTFDTGVYVSGLFDLYLLTKKEALLKEANKSLRWLYSIWEQRPFAAVDNVPGEKDWYHVPSVHLLKLVIPLIKASRILGDKKYKRTALGLLDKYKQLQNDDGSFKIGEDASTIMTHPHCYATEGLLYAYYTLEGRELLEAAKKSGAWLSKAQNSDGSFYLSYGVGSKTELEKIKATDSTAQATRIWKLLGINKDGIEKAYKYLDSERNKRGLRLYKIESMQTFVHSWPTFFYIHSLLMPFGEMEYCRELF